MIQSRAMQRRSIALAALATLSLSILPLPVALAQATPLAKQRPTNRPSARAPFFYRDHPAAMAFAEDPSRSRTWPRFRCA